MNEEQLGSLVSSWLQEGNHPPSDPTASVRTAMQAATKTRQLRHRRWLPPNVLRMSNPPSRPQVVDTGDYQPSPIPASNGHIPTAFGRTTPMLSPVKAITAGALLAATGAALLIAQPFSERTQPPGAVEAAAPVAVTGMGSPGICPELGTVERGDSLHSFRDGYCHPSWVMSDERLTGKVTWATNEDQYLDESGLLVRVLRVSVVNDEGSWLMQPEVQFGRRDIREGLPSQFVLVGHGAYESLHAVLAWDNSTYELSGYILSGGFPPEPVVPSAP